MGGTNMMTGLNGGMTAGLEYKQAAASPESGLLSAEDDTGVVEAIVSVTGVVDGVDDLIEPGAYTKTLQARRPKGIFVHDWHRWVARTEEIRELPPGDPALPKQTKDGQPWPKEAGGLYVKARFNLGTSEGADAYQNVKFFSESGECDWSIGYKVPKGCSTRRKDGVRQIKQLDLYEYSPVLFGAAGSFSGTLSVKDAAGNGDPGEGEDGGQSTGEAADGGTENSGDTAAGDAAEGATEGATAAPGAAQGADGGGTVAAGADGGTGGQGGAESPDGENLDDGAGDDTAGGGEGGVDWDALDTEADRLLFGEGIEVSGTGDGTGEGEGGPEAKRFVPMAQRHAMAKRGTAMPDGSFPIANREDLKNAVQAFGRAKNKTAAKAHILKRARALGCMDLVPDDWKTGNSGKSAGADLETKMAHEPLDRSPRKNWVEEAGQLPAYIQHIAKDIHEQKGVPLSVAIPTAIAAVKRWAAGGGGVSADTRAKAAAAVAEWEALKAKSHLRRAGREAAHAAKTLDDLLDGISPGDGGNGGKDGGEDGFTGTYEELRDLLAAKAAEVLDDTDGEYLIDVIGTWPDRCIVTRFPIGDGERKAESFECSYTTTSGTVDLGDPVPVEVTVTGTDGTAQPVTGLLPYAAAIDDVVTGVKAYLLAHSGSSDGDGNGGEEVKAGRVLSGANSDRIKAAVENLISVLQAAGVDVGGNDDEGDDTGSSAEGAVTPDSTAPATRVKTVEGQLLPSPADVARGYRILADA